jgi:hypothetical protein
MPLGIMERPFCNHPSTPLCTDTGLPSVPCKNMRASQDGEGHCGPAGALFVLRDQEATSPAAAPSPIPAIGQPWPGIEGSAYAGLSRGEDGQPDAHLVLLPDLPASELNWKDAKAWAHSVGGQLPTRRESALLYAQVFDKVEVDAGWYWTGTQCSDGFAWIQSFGDGVQLYYGKKYEARARAVRRFPV